MRLVLDTNVTFSALLWDGKPGLLLESARKKELRLYTSEELLNELRGVLKRRKFAWKIAESHFTADQLLLRYLELVTVVVPREIPRVSVDPDDDVVLGTALAAEAECIVSGDSDLRVISTYCGIPILSPSAALDFIGKL